MRLPGTGPFKVKEFQPGQILELEANRSYWDGAPQIDGVRFLSIPELSGRVTALLNDEIDVTWGVPDDQIAVLKKRPDVKVEIAPSVVYLYSWFNSGRKPFTDAARPPRALARDRRRARRRGSAAADRQAGPRADRLDGVRLGAAGALHLRSQAREAASGRGRLSERLQGGDEVLRQLRLRRSTRWRRPSRPTGRRSASRSGRCSSSTRCSRPTSAT